jgi:hypothetical protein
MDITSEFKTLPTVDEFRSKMTKVLKFFKVCTNIPMKERIELMLQIADINPADKLNDFKKEAINTVLTTLLERSVFEVKCLRMLVIHSAAQYKQLIKDVGPEEAIRIASGLGGSSKKSRIIRRRIKKNRRTRRNKSNRKRST